MDSISVERLGKRYSLARLTPQSWRQRLAMVLRIGRANQPDGRGPQEIWALKDVSFAVRPGTILGIIGPNGAGKTTLLKVLGRVTLPTEGRVVGRGRVISLLEVGAGFQPELSGRENVFLNAALYGIPRAEVDRRLVDIVEWAELKDFIDVPVKSYSTGMYLRLAFSVAVNMEPDILLADEVLAVGDLAFQERCLQRVEKAGAAGQTVLFVSHDMAAISRLCDRVIWLNAGRVVADGEPTEIVGRYEESAWTLVGDGRKGSDGSQAATHGEIISTRLVSSAGKQVGAVRAADEVFLKVTFNADVADATARCALDVYTGDILAFRSWQPQPMSIPRPGIYSATARIPAHLLSDTTYSANMKVVLIGDGPHRHLVGDKAVTFRVYHLEDGLSGPRTDRRRRSGVVAPRLEWQAAREHDDVNP